MSKTEINSQLHAVVVGGADGFAADAVDVLSRRGIECVFCDDVYSAVGAFAGNGAGPMLVIGPLDELAKEQGRFFDIVRRRGYKCCCVADEGARDTDTMPLDERQDELAVCRADHLGRTIASLIDGDQIRRRFMRQLARGDADENKGEIHTSRAEMEALLGLWVDERGTQTDRP